MSQLYRWLSEKEKISRGEQMSGSRCFIGVRGAWSNCFKLQTCTWRTWALLLEYRRRGLATGKLERWFKKKKMVKWNLICALLVSTSVWAVHDKAALLSLFHSSLICWFKLHWTFRFCFFFVGLCLHFLLNPRLSGFVVCHFPSASASSADFTSSPALCLKSC